MNKEIIFDADIHYIPATTLSAGNIRMIYEAGRLRYLSAGDTEIVRTIYPALRNRNWATIIPKITEEKISKKADSFSISYRASYEQEEIKYRADYKIEGSADGTITFDMKGEALGRFQRQRIGLCFLHSIDSCAGREVEIIQPDHSGYRSSFPVLVKPTQPFMNIKGMKWVTAEQVLVEVDFEGDVFETEDQRNWSDNSYKTYSTPLALPAPVTVNPGDRVEQKITLRVHDGKIKQAQKDVAKPVKLPIPNIGYTLLLDAGRITDQERALLENIPFDHFAVSVNAGNSWAAEWKRVADNVSLLKTKAALFLRFEQFSDEEISAVVKSIAASVKIISSVLVLSADGIAPLESFDKVYRALKAAAGEIPVGYGCPGNFADLNRNRPGDHLCDFLHFHLYPQVHASDSRTIMENLNSQEAMFRTAAQFANGKPIQVSVNFSDTGEDERFPTAFAAWWTLQTLRNFAGAPAVNFYYLSGKESITGTGNSIPLYKALRSIKEWDAKYILQHTGSRVIVENDSGDQLSFSSKLPAPDAMFN